MDETGGENQAQRFGIIVGILAALLVLRRLRKRRKAKKLLKAKAKARARVVEQRMKEEKARQKATKKAGGKGKKGKKERSIVEQIVRFTILAVMKKVISQQIETAGKELGGSKLGKKVVQATES
jgi:Na+/glutamate symporter